VRTTARFAFAPGVTLAVAGPEGDVGQLAREYGPVRQPAGDERPGAGSGAGSGTGASAGTGAGAIADSPALSVSFGSAPALEGAARVSGGHKSVGWTVALSAADDPATTLGVALSGVPRGFARSLVQGYFVEPLLSVVAAEAGQLLLPSAGIVTADGLRILIGKSRAGKSTLAARSLAAGRHVIGDDQVLVDGSGAWRPYPRRLRFYPDLRFAAPTAWEALPTVTRARLRGRGLVAALTRGFVRPSLAVEPAELGGHWDPEPMPATRIVLLERSADVDEVTLTAGDAAQALAWAATVLGEQRAKLRRIEDAGWQARLDAVDARERAILGSAIDGLPVDVVRIPIGWPAPRAVTATERRLGLAPG
jgi:hypothetical protein